MSTFGGTVLNQVGQAVEILAMAMLVYLVISLFISMLLNYVNKKMEIQGKIIMPVFDQQSTRKPPISQIGAILWLKTNLFSTWINTALTAAAIYLLYIMIPPLLDWMFFNASFSFGTINSFWF